MLKLFKILIGATPKGRHTEQHDVFFGIGKSLQDLVPSMKVFWPEAADVMHVDAFRAITKVGDYAVSIVPKQQKIPSDVQLYFINLGGYKENEFDEFHYKLIIVAKTKAEAIRKAKQSAFYKHTSFKGAQSHIDDKYGIDVDDIHDIEDILSETDREKYAINIKLAEDTQDDDQYHLGYFKLSKIENGIFDSE
jgi:hypothetical protein